MRAKASRKSSRRTIAERSQNDAQTIPREAELTAHRRDESWLKDDLVQHLEAHLRANASTLASRSAFSDFYQRTGSPIKGATKVPVPDDGSAEPKPRKRRQTKIKEEPDSP